MEKKSAKDGSLKLDDQSKSKVIQDSSSLPLRRVLVAGGATMYLAGWAKPLVKSVVLPAHATTSEVSDSGGETEEPVAMATCMAPLPGPFTAPGFNYLCARLAQGQTESLHYIYELDDSNPSSPSLNVSQSTSPSFDVQAPSRGFAIENRRSSFDTLVTITADGAPTTNNNFSMIPEPDINICIFRGGGNQDGSPYEIPFTSTSCGNSYIATFTLRPITNMDETMLSYEVSEVSVRLA